MEPEWRAVKGIEKSPSGGPVPLPRKLLDEITGLEELVEGVTRLGVSDYQALFRRVVEEAKEVRARNSKRQREDEP